MFAVAVLTGLAGSLLLRRLHVRSLITRQPIRWDVARPERRHVIGSVIFECGWAIASSCPGPIATQLSTGLWWSALTISGMAVGILTYLLLHERRTQRSDAAQNQTSTRDVPARASTAVSG